MSPVPVSTYRRSTGTALIELIAERGWDDVAVQDACERANVGPLPFCLHYPNKDALLQGGLNELQTELQGQAQALLPSARSGLAPPGLRFIPGLIAHANEQRFREMVIRLISEELPDSPDSLPRAALAAGALSNC